LWLGSEEPNDPVVTKSRTAGWVFLPLEIRSPDRNLGLHMMAEYVALSSVMRELLPLNRLVKTAAQIVTGDDNNKIVTKSDVFEDNNGALTVATLPKITPKKVHFPISVWPNPKTCL
jgi:hypothetical protein